ncbi:MAG: hypothetical protein IJN63_07435 [Clostridia bacterium]|nr:hypothetical protein [Clostridia bacterium]
MRKKKQFTVCRACGSEVELSGTVLCCKECGAKQLYPRDAEEETKGHYADAFRYMCHDDFYSALRLFEAISKTGDNAAAHFGIFVAKYGLGADREHITGNIIHSCKRRNTADVMEDADLQKALQLADKAERAAIKEVADFIYEEQRRLEREEREAAAKAKNALTEDGLAVEFDTAQKNAEEKAKREKAEADRIAEEARAEEKRRYDERNRRIEKAKKQERTAKIAKIAVPAALLAVVLVLVSVFAVVPAIRYSSAVKSYESGDYAAAADIFRDLGDHKRSEDYLGTIPFYGLEAGDVIEFGDYYRSNAVVKFPIEWVVLEADDESVLLISKYVLEVKKYNEEHISVTWETSDLREYLNGEFYEAAFDASDREQIIESEISNPNNTSQGTLGGNATVDRVFALSFEEAEKYLIGKEYAYGYPTDYVKALGVYEDEEGGTGRCWYWLRSPGSSQSNAAKMEYDGTVSYRGSMIHYSKYGVRPAIRVRVEKVGTLID